MIQRSLDYYFKQTKHSEDNKAKSRNEVITKQRRNSTSVGFVKVPETPLNSPLKSTLCQTLSMKSNRAKDCIIILDDLDEDSPPESPTAPSLPSTSSNPSKLPRTPQNPSETPEQKKSSQMSGRTPRTQIPRPSPSQPPKYCVFIDDSDEDDSPPTLHTPQKPPENSPSPENTPPKRPLSFTSCKSPSKRHRINEIMFQQLTKENSFQAYALTTTTSIVESMNPAKVLALEATKEISFSKKSESIIKEELMLSEDEEDPAEMEMSFTCSRSPTTSVKSPPTTCLRILPPETINRKFDSHQNCQQSSQATQKVIKREGSTEVDGLGDLEMRSSPQTPRKASNPTSFRTPERSPTTSLPRSPSQSPMNNLGTPFKRSPSTFSPTKMSPTKRNYRPRKIFKENANLQTVVENLNLARQGAIPVNDFDLEEIYKKREFEFQWGRIDTSTAEQYDIRDVVAPNSKHSERLFEMISWVFSEPANCGYFDEGERDLVFRMLSASHEEQVLLAIMLKREIRWFRVRKQKYEKHIAGDMENSLMGLTEKGFFDSNWESVDMEIIFNLLQVDELKELCKRMKMNHTVVKPKMIASLKQLLSQKTSHFSTTSPREALKSRLLSVAGPILKLSDNFIALIHRILVLYYPNHNPEDKLSDVFYLFSEVHYGNKTFPSTPIDRFPLFNNRQALSDYVESKLVWMEIAQIMNEKNKGASHWEAARECGTKAYDKLTKLIDEPCTNPQKLPSKLPSHIARFTSTYVWSKVLLLSIEAFKKLKIDGYVRIEIYLEFLLNNRDKIPVSFGKLYKELTMVEMSHLRDLERSAELTIEAFTVTSSMIDQAEMMERARKLSRRAKGISLITKNRLKEIIAEKEEDYLCLPKEEEIEVVKVDREGCWGKSLWKFNIGDEDKCYGNVEDVALRHYANIGYPKGIHCEGALPVTIFACLFWREIYELPVPGAFVSPFQEAPLDLFGSKFYLNREEYFSRKFMELEGLEDFETVWVNMMEAYRNFGELESIICRVVDEPELFYEIIKCLGKNGVLGICKRILVGGYVNWRSGFPDLFVWNEKKWKCKVVEVKGPGDTLSVKQKLWIKCLEEIGVRVEVCLVKAKQQC